MATDMKDCIDRRKPGREVPVKHMIATVFASVAIMFMIVCLLLVSFWLFYPYKTIETTPEQFPIVGDINLKQGSDLTYSYSYQKYTDAPVTIERRFVDGLIFLSSNETVITEKGTGNVRVRIHIPETLPPGKYYLEIVAKYEVNPIRTITITKRTKCFIVNAAN